MIWMEKHIGAHTPSPAAIKTPEEIRKNLAQKYDIRSC